MSETRPTKFEGFPIRRTSGVVCEPLGDDLTVLDELSDDVHVLNPTMAAVWMLCDGRRNAAVIAEAIAERFDCSGSLDPLDVTQGALETLQRLRLIEGMG